MVVTPFGNFELGDDIALERWIDAHARRHSAYTVATGIAGGSLRGHIDGDWFHRHWARHSALATFTGVILPSSTAGLAVSSWDTEQELREWHELHNRIHLLIDRQLKIS